MVKVLPWRRGRQRWFLIEIRFLWSLMVLIGFFLFKRFWSNVIGYQVVFFKYPRFQAFLTWNDIVYRRRVLFFGQFLIKLLEQYLPKASITKLIKYLHNAMLFDVKKLYFKSSYFWNVVSKQNIKLQANIQPWFYQHYLYVPNMSHKVPQLY